MLLMLACQYDQTPPFSSLPRKYTPLLPITPSSFLLYLLLFFLLFSLPFCSFLLSYNWQNKELGGPVCDFDDAKSSSSSYNKRTTTTTTTTTMIRSSRSTSGPWLDNAPTHIKPCWSLPSSEGEWKSQGYVTFSLTNGPKYNVSQVVDAVVVARYLGATLVFPDIRGTSPGDNMDFGEVYDVNKFIKILDEAVKVGNDQSSKLSSHNIALVKVPNWVTEDHISEQINPIFNTKGNIRLSTYFPSANMKIKTNQNGNNDSIACLGMFGTLELQTEVREVVNSMIKSLRTLSQKSNGQFVAVDLKVDMLEKKGCQRSGIKSCYNLEEIALFLRKIGYDKDTTLYLTQSKWESSLDFLRDFFLKT